MGLTQSRQSQSPAPPTFAAETMTAPAATTSGAGPAPSSSRTLRLGSEGADVQALQGFLGIDVSGSFDAATESAVKNFQRTRGLDADGVVGRDTFARLNQAAPKAPAASATASPAPASAPTPAPGAGPAAAVATPSTVKATPTGDLKSPWHDDAKFVPAYPATAASESEDQRKKSDPYAVGAITHPSKKQDRGGKTYGTYQFESYVYNDGSKLSKKAVKGSTLMAFVNDPQNPYGADLKAAIEKDGVASATFDEAWTKLTADHNKDFGNAQEAFLLRNTATAVAAFMDSAAIKGDARKDARLIDLVIGTINQYGDSLGPGIAAACAAAQAKAGRDFNATEAARAIQDFKGQNVKSNFKSSPRAWDGITNRIDRERIMFDTPPPGRVDPSSAEA